MLNCLLLYIFFHHMREHDKQWTAIYVYKFDNTAYSILLYKKFSSFINGFDLNKTGRCLLSFVFLTVINVNILSSIHWGRKHRELSLRRKHYKSRRLWRPILRCWRKIPNSRRSWIRREASLWWLISRRPGEKYGEDKMNVILVGLLYFGLVSVSHLFHLILFQRNNRSNKKI